MSAAVNAPSLPPPQRPACPTSFTTMDAAPPPAPPPALAPLPRPPSSRRVRTTTMPDVPVAALLLLAATSASHPPSTINFPPSPPSGTSTRSLHAMVARALAAVVSPHPPSPPSSLRRGRTTARRPVAARAKRRGDPDARPASRRRRTRTVPAAAIEHSESDSDDNDDNDNDASVDGMDIDVDTDCTVPVVRVDSGTLAEWTAPGGLSAPPNSPLSASPPANLLSHTRSSAGGYPSPPTACALSPAFTAQTPARAPCSPPYSPRARHSATPAVLARAAAHGHVGKRVGPALSPEGLAAAAKRRARVRQAMTRLAQDLEGVHLVDEQESAPPPPPPGSGSQW
ncbi:hypothetical protein AMAG_11632 [Allomyces macrogynus ATCC 38327]|uniref:Uncharacterized protein n=1 Tax=Allomyces macrogynus (strain ATCC 38327) TaxID=578462 RepID=A0A0L0SVB1_ALLM3|nr:hypothetical protein AMAG_11632 [Allomyces macrogynus ATCC 38327]|eukprot:KNE66498.1 hypothetical protein AMAG_11632 [Allomyces macrogynus ATCC 38327]